MTVNYIFLYRKGQDGERIEGMNFGKEENPLSLYNYMPLEPTSYLGGNLPDKSALPKYFAVQRHSSV
jgi:hypothetical protein